MTLADVEAANNFIGSLSLRASKMQKALDDQQQELNGIVEAMHNYQEFLVVEVQRLRDVSPGEVATSV